MVSNRAVLLALRSRLETLVIATTGSTVLSSTYTGFARSSGSFVADGFLVGMEVLAAGWGDVHVDVITGVSALELNTARPMEESPPTAGRTVTAGLPAGRAWENVPFDPFATEWYVREEYLPGPQALIAGNDDHGEYEAYPAYVLTLYGMPGTGAGALYAASDAVLRHFRPALHLFTSDGHAVRVRTDSAPYSGQLFSDVAHSAIEVTIPLSIRTSNNAP